MTLQHVDLTTIKGPVYILPFCCVGIVISHLLQRNGIEVVGFGDNNPDLAGKAYQGIPILSPEQAYKENADATFIIATYRFRKELAAQLEELGADAVVYAGQFLTLDYFQQGLDDMDESAARDLGGWDDPKNSARYDAPYFWLAEPRMDKNLVLRWGLTLPVGKSFGYPAWKRQIEQANSEVDYIEQIIIYLKAHTTNTDFSTTIQDIPDIRDIIKILEYVNTSDNPPRIFCVYFNYSEKSNETAHSFHKRLAEAGIPTLITDDLQKYIVQMDANRPRVLICHKTAYSDVEKRCRCVYAHIPKNAGTSMNKYLHDKNDIFHDHNKFMRDSKAFDSESFRDFFKFAIVRNPWDRFVSIYFYKKMRANENGYTLEGIWGAPTFRDAVLRLRDTGMSLDTQYSYICDENGNILADYIGRFENLQESFEYIADKLGLDTSKPIPHVNANKHKPYTEYYDEEMVEIIRNAYKKDIEMFGYEFDKHPGPNIVVNPREDFIPAALARNANYNIT